MKVALVLDRFNPLMGGLERFAHRLGKWLLGHGHDVHVSAFEFDDPDRLPVICHPAVPRTSKLDRAAALEKSVRAASADVIQDFGAGWHYDVLRPGYGARPAALRRDYLSLPPVLRLWSHVSPGYQCRRKEMLAMERRQYERSEGIVVAVSRMVQRDLVELCGLSPERITMVYNGADVDRFTPALRAKHRTRMREELGLKNEVLFLFVAHNFRLKGLGTALRALHRLRSQECRAHLLVLGHGPARFYRFMAQRLGIARDVTFCGAVHDVRPYFGVADASIHPTFYDPCSQTTLEAWASGLPVITTRHNGASELMTDGHEGFILDEADNPRAAAESMQQLLDPSLRKRMSEAARDLALRHTLDTTHEQLMSLYREVTGKRRRNDTEQEIGT